MDIDKISKELYEYIVSKPYGTEVSTSSCLRELYNLESEYIDQHVGWILTNGELKLSDMELFDIDAKLHKLIRESGTYFIDSTMYVGACVGLPFNVGGDWAGKGKVRRYVDITCDDALDPDLRPYATIEELEKAIPEIDWQKGHSGQLLTDEQVEKIEQIVSKNYI